MTTIGNLIGNKADSLVRSTLSIGDVHLLPLGREESITAKDGASFRNKFLVILGFDNQGNAVGGVVINSNINNNLPSSITDYLMPVTVNQCPFLQYNSFVNCSHLIVVKKEKFNSNTYKGSIKDKEIMDMIIGTLCESPYANKQQLLEFGIIQKANKEKEA